MSISLLEYFTNPTTGAVKSHTDVHEDRAMDLLDRREALRQEYYAATGKGPEINPNTGTEISGLPNGSGDGGFRLPGATTGKTLSAHKEARAVDDSDVSGDFDRWLDTFETGDGGNSKLEERGLYREHPLATKTWTHLSTRAPASNKRTYMP